jgi:ferredoxin
VSFRVAVDLDTCQGYANCVVAAPEIFDIDDEKGTAIVLLETPQDSLRAAAEDAVRQCPTEAITLEG